MVINTLDGTNHIANHLAADAMRIAQGRPPASRRKFTPVTPDQINKFSGRYETKNGEIAKIKPVGENLFLLGDGMPLQIKPVNNTDFMIDGRLMAEGVAYGHLKLSFRTPEKMDWKGKK